MNAVEFENFIETYEKDLFSFCCYLSGDAVCDLFQDTVLTAFEMREKIDLSGNPKSFLFSIAVGKWKNMKRKANRRMAIAPEIVFDDYMGEDESNPEKISQKTFINEAIENALANLNDNFRIPLILYYFDEQNLENISEVCKIPKGTVKSRLHKGRALLKAALEREGIYD